MKRIAIFCALPPERNTGMATVDLAAFSAVRRLAPDAEITLYTYGKAGEHTYQPGELPYHYVDVTKNEERFFSSDVFIFWGDFIHSRPYWFFQRSLWKNIPGPRADRETWWREQFGIRSRYIFLSSLPESRLKDAIVFGGTIITNEARDRCDTIYYRDFVRFFKNAGAAYLRDPLSAAKVSPYRGGEASLGCDCVFLMRNSDLDQVPGFRPASVRKGVGVFLGRSPSRLRMLLFARAVATHLGEPCSWLPWLALWERRHRWPLAALGFSVTAGNTDIAVVLSALSGCKYIVTDTYHLCINAWRMGIPTICIGQGTGTATTALGDKKKEILYEMYGARQFYVFLEAIRPLRGLFSEARRASGVLENGELVAAVSANMALHGEMALQRLRHALQSRLDGRHGV